MEKKWILHQPEPSAQAQALSQALSTTQAFPISLAEILVRRGIDSFEKARAFFKPEKSEMHDPLLMQDMDRAVERVVSCYEKGEKILVYGDYDVDGTTSVSLVSLFFDRWGFDADIYIPDRYTEGYGLSYKGIEYAEEKGCKLLITLDCGIKAIEKARFAAERKIDLIICDHHTPGEELPQAVAVLDPKRSDCDYPFKELTGCGVGFKMCLAVHQALLNKGHVPKSGVFDPFETFAGLLALSIACDIVPIVGENRIMAYWGVKKIQAAPSVGIQAIMNLSQNPRPWNISDLVFFIGPHINAAGRLHHATQAVSILRGDDEKNLPSLSKALGQANEDRKKLDKEIVAQALQMIETDPDFKQKHSTVLFNKNWHKGVIGIVASRLIEKHYRPTILLTESEGKLVGSARSVKGFNLYDAIDSCAEHTIQFGGHKYAAGLTMKAESFSDFSQAFDKAVKNKIEDSQKMPQLRIDAEVNFAQIDERYLRLLNRFAPFGPHNMSPNLMSQNVEVAEARVLKELHVRFTFRQSGRTFSAIAFNMAAKWHALNCLHLDIVFHPSLESWKGKTYIQLRLKDFRLASSH